MVVDKAETRISFNHVDIRLLVMDRFPYDVIDSSVTSAPH